MSDDRNRWPYVAGTDAVLGATVWAYEGGDGKAVAWTGIATHNFRYNFNAAGDVDRPPVDVGARLREELRH